MGDFNVHSKNVEHNNSRKLHDITGMFNLTQSVSQPTPNQGHLLDSVFSKQIVPGDQLDSHLSKLHHSPLTSDQHGGHHSSPHNSPVAVITHPSPLTRDQTGGHHSTRHLSPLTSDQLGVHHSHLITRHSPVINLVVTTPQFTTRPSPVINLVVTTPQFTTRPSPVTNMVVTTPHLIIHQWPIWRSSLTPHHSPLTPHQWPIWRSSLTPHQWPTWLSPLHSSPLTPHQWPTWRSSLTPRHSPLTSDQPGCHHSTPHHSPLTSDQPGGHHSPLTTHPSPVTNLAVTTPHSTTHPSPVSNLAVTTPFFNSHPSPVTNPPRSLIIRQSAVNNPGEYPSTPLRSVNCSDNPIVGVESSVFDNRPLASDTPLKSCKPRILICVPLTTSSSADDKLLVSLFNARSAGTAQKRTEIWNFVQDQNIDILFITETWLTADCDEAKCADMCPAGYSAKSFPRLSRGAGLAVIYRSSLQRYISVGYFWLWSQSVRTDVLKTVCFPTCYSSSLSVSPAPQQKE